MPVGVPQWRHRGRTERRRIRRGFGLQCCQRRPQLRQRRYSYHPATGVPTPGTAYSRVTAGAGFLNLGLNLGGAANAGGGAGPTPTDIRASGIASSVINAIGANRNNLTSQGILANTTVLGTVFSGPNGSDNVVTSTGPVSVAFVRQGIFSESAPLRLAATRCTVTGTSVCARWPRRRQYGQTVVTAGPGNRINIAFPFNNNGVQPFSGPAASNSNSFAPTTFANGSSNGSGGDLSGSLTNSSKQFSSSLKKLSAGVQKALGNLGKKKQNSPPKTETDS